MNSYLVQPQTSIFITEPPVALFSGAIQDAQGDVEKHSIFKPVSKAEKLRKPSPRASKKHQKSTLESPISVFCGNMVFAIPSMRKPCTQKSLQTVTWKQAQKKQRIKPIGAQKAFKTSSPNQPKSTKITKNLVLGPHVSFHGPLGCP